MSFDPIRPASDAEASFYGSSHVYQDENGEALVAAPDPTLPPPQQSPGPYPHDVVEAIIAGLPSLQDSNRLGAIKPSRQRKMGIVLALIRTRGLISWNAPPESDPALGSVWSAYVSSEAEGDSAAASWPD